MYLLYYLSILQKSPIRQDPKLRVGASSFACLPSWLAIYKSVLFPMSSNAAILLASEPTSFPPGLRIINSLWSSMIDDSLSHPSHLKSHIPTSRFSDNNNHRYTTVSLIRTTNTILFYLSSINLLLGCFLVFMEPGVAFIWCRFGIVGFFLPIGLLLGLIAYSSCCGWLQFGGPHCSRES